VPADAPTATAKGEQRETPLPPERPGREKPAEKPAVPDEHVIKVRYDMDELPDMQRRSEVQARRAMQASVRSARYQSYSDVGVA
jgi:hypothetical protein